MENVTLNEARQNALNALNDIVLYGNERDTIEAAMLLLSEEFPEIEPETIVDEEDNCDCPLCAEGDDLPGDDNLGLIFTYGVFGQ